jgi:Cell Wall Hydrolase
MQYSLQGRVAKLGIALVAFSTLTSFAGGLSSSIDHTRENGLVGNPTSKLLSDVPLPEPLIFQDITRQSALAINSAIPFSSRPNFAAAPFMLTGTADSRDRAVDCLASAMWYEAGNDATGQYAVAQVVLNRVRHPAFPNSVCGVVFQGTERTTGCQFTFTCDGALRRTPSASVWTETRARAMAALTGSVFARVGLATHYHTDWVHPVWSAKLEKIASVDTHLFFRWSGKWGRIAAMSRTYVGTEESIAKLARISMAHKITSSDAEIAIAEATLQLSAEPIALAEAAFTSPSSVSTSPVLPPSTFLIDVASTGNGGASAMSALKLCGGDTFCKVLGWAADSGLKPSFIPSAGTVREDIAFLYVRDRRTGVDRAFWDCDRFARPDVGQCLTGENRRWIDFKGNLGTDRNPAGSLATG